MLGNITMKNPSAICHLPSAMRLLLCLLSVFSVSSVVAQPFLVPTNPPAYVVLGWDASPDPSVNGYRVYYGVGSRQYTNMVIVGNTNTATVQNLVRGQKYYFAATATTSDGLESDFSNEIDYTPRARPAPPASPRKITWAVNIQLDSAPTLIGPWFTETNYQARLDPGFYRAKLTTLASSR
jgi:hypothetical protein